jgi:hypothetical protein
VPHEPVLGAVIFLLVGAFFIGVAASCVPHGRIPLKRGGAVERSNDRLGFWAGVVGLAALGLFALLSGAQHLLVALAAR